MPGVLCRDRASHPGGDQRQFDRHGPQAGAVLVRRSQRYAADGYEHRDGDAAQGHGAVPVARGLCVLGWLTTLLMAVAIMFATLRRGDIVQYVNCRLGEGAIHRDDDRPFFRGWFFQCLKLTVQQ